MSEQDVMIARISGLLRDALFIEPPGSDTDLIEGGMIDSAGFMELFLALEGEFDIRIEASDLDLAHFRTVESIASFVTDKVKTRLAAGPGRP